MKITEPVVRAALARHFAGYQRNLRQNLEAA